MEAEDFSASVLGISKADLSKVPPPPRTLNRNDTRWRMIRQTVQEKPGEWFEIPFDTGQGAQYKASHINSNKSVMFPSKEFEARYARNGTKSILYLRCKP